MKTTDLNLIPLFVAIYEESNLSKAARRLGISQPAVSKGLARLREIYGDPLFHRVNSGVSATVFASDMYPAMAAALKNFQTTLSSARDFNPKTAQKIFSIACISTASYELMPRLIKRIRANAPYIGLEVHPLFTRDYETDLRLQRYDLIVDMRPHSTSLLKHEVISKERLMIICSRAHPRIGDTIDLNQFLAEEHVVVSRWQSRSSLLSERELPEIKTRRIIYRAAGAMEMLPVIDNSEFIGIVPDSTYQAFKSKYNIKALAAPFARTEHDLCAIWHPSRHTEASHQWLRNQLKLAARHPV